MSEIIDSVPNFETPQQRGDFRPVAIHSNEVGLHNEAMQVPEQALLSLDETRNSHLINGQLLAEITLPAPTEDGQLKKLGLVDFGPDTQTGSKAILYRNGKELRNLGTTRHRYAVMALNYGPGTHMVGFQAINEGDNNIGRSPRESRNDYEALGLYNTPENRKLSREHLTVTLGADGRLTITDHSKNATTVRTAAAETTDAGEHAVVSERSDVLGSLAIRSTIEHDHTVVERDRLRAVIDNANAELERLSAGLSAEDRVAVWKYGTAHARLVDMEDHWHSTGEITRRYRDLENLSHNEREAATALPKSVLNVAQAYGAHMANRQVSVRLLGTLEARNK